MSEEKIVKMKNPKKPAVIYPGFCLLAIYIIAIVCIYGNSKHITSYEVKEGSLAIDNTYRGICVRTESIFTAADDGYINYYAREGEKVANGTMVYTIDETGKLSELLRSGYETGGGLTNADMNELKTQIQNYRNEYNDRAFESIYDFKFQVAGTVNKLANKNVMDSLNSVTDRSVLDLVNFGRTTDSGIVVYSIDGLETLTDSDINETIFDEEEHAKNQLQANALVSNGDPVYKLITEENWGIVIEVDEERFKELEEKGYVKVKFLKTGDISWGKVNGFTGNDGKLYCRLEFTNSMITYATDRYLDIELLMSTKSGLKIPNSAIVEKEFYLIPESYKTQGDGEDKEGFTREAVMEDGTPTEEFIEVQIYDEKDGECYVDANMFNPNDHLINADKEIFTIGKKDKLLGVYNMNKGYADFVKVSIEHQNREYAIVKPDSVYGLAVYDHIVLDGSAVNDDDFIFE